MQRKHHTVPKNKSIDPPGIPSNSNAQVSTSAIPIQTSTLPTSTASSHQTENTIQSFMLKPLTADAKREAKTKITKMIIQGYHPFSIVEEPAFIELLKHFCPNFQPPNRKAISNSLIPSMHKKNLEIVKKMITSAKAVALTTDSWTNINNTSFNAVAAHFIDNNNLQLHSYLLKCSEFSVSYTGKNIAE